MLISFFLILVPPLPLPLRLSLFCPYLRLCLCLCFCLRVNHCRPEFFSSRLCQLLALYLFPTRVRVLPSSPTLPSSSLHTTHTPAASATAIKQAALHASGVRKNLRVDHPYGQLYRSATIRVAQESDTQSPILCTTVCLILCLWVCVVSVASRQFFFAHTSFRNKDLVAEECQ